MDAIHVQAVLVRLTAFDITRLKNSAKAAQKIENRWEKKIQSFIEKETRKVIKSLHNFEQIPEIDFERLFIQQAFESIILGYRVAMRDDNPKIHLARLPKSKIPRSLHKVMELYDLWKKGKYTPKRPAAQAKQIKALYLKKIQNVWKKYSEDFRRGETHGGEKIYNQDEVAREIREEARTTINRAKTIVRTETTNYYNGARKKYYDESQDVTHYIFMAIRDKATSPWCSPTTINGLRGRHGLVYAKDDPLLKQEMPACHWCCRSEILPLTAENAIHAKLINDKSIQRRNVKCYPLPSGWGNR